MQRVIIILGMHRSGTSALAGSLEEAGLFLGNVNRDAPHNKKGNCESPTLMAMQEDLLISSGGGWDNPPDNVNWLKKHRDIRDAFIKTYQFQKIWGFKDPRTLYTLKGWLEVLPFAEFVGIFRDPLSVAQSLKARNQFLLDKSIALWGRYNKRLIQLYKKDRFPIIYFDRDANNFLQKLDNICNRLCLPVKSIQKTFFEDDLRKQKTKLEYVLPEEINSIYKFLSNISI